MSTMQEDISSMILSQNDFEGLMAEIFDRLKENITDADVCDGGHYSFYVLGYNGEVLENDWKDIFKDYPDGVESMFLAYTNDLDSVENLTKIPVGEWRSSADKLYEDNQDDLDFVFYTESD